MRFWLTNTPRTTFVELQQLNVCLVINDLFIKSDITSTEKFQAPTVYVTKLHTLYILDCCLQITGISVMS